MKKSLLIFLSIIVLASTFFESCVTIRPRCKKDEVSDTTGRYHVITVPYYRKKANVVGSLFVLAVAGGAAVTAYQNSTTLESQIHSRTPVDYPPPQTLSNFFPCCTLTH